MNGPTPLPFWRTVFTDTESESGVGPVCDNPDQHAAWEAQSVDPEYQNASPAGPDVYDCCRGPHLQCSNEPEAAELARWLNEHEVSICD